jgi:hypothetical protein
MSDSNDFPEGVQKVLASYGTPLEITPLSGLSHNPVWRVCFSETCVVVKVNVQEERFYRLIAPQLPDVPVPELIASVKAEEVYWHIIEFIPEPLPRSRWSADPEMLSVLFRLHQTPLEAVVVDSSLFQPFWDDALTEAALNFLPDSDRSPLATIV